METLHNFFSKNRIDHFALLPFSECTVTRPYLYASHEGFIPRSVLLFLVPYYAGKAENLSVYAAAPDYHRYMKELHSSLESHLSHRFPEYRFFGFADHSPIDERLAAVKAGLGVFGKNGLLITEKYSSFVFIGEVLTDAPAEVLGTPSPVSSIRSCKECGACLAACPTGILRKEGNAPCLSAVTQKKGELTESEAELIRTCGTAWGCDICQNVCPYTKNAEKNGTLITPIPYFRENRVEKLTSAVIEEMPDEEFKTRAFAWRGKKPLLRNLAILEEKN